MLAEIDLSSHWVRLLPLSLIAPSIIGFLTSRTHSTRAFTLTFAVLLSSATLAAWIAPERATAFGKLGLIVGGMGLAAALAGARTMAQLETSLALVAAGGAALGLFFLATNDWFAPPVKFEALARLGALLSSVSPVTHLRGLHPNVVAGVLVGIWPFAVAMAWGSPPTRARFMTACVAIIGLCLFLTASRGAWMAAVIAGAAWAAAANPKHRLRLGLVTAIVSAGIVAVSFPAILQVWSPSGRLSIQWRAWTLARDYAFTGAGLSSFPMQYAAYAEAATVQSSVHAHQTLLDMQIEQGIGGSFAWLALFVLTAAAASRARQRSNGVKRWMADACLASAAGIVLHGLVDDTLYASRGLPALFLPAGVSMAVAALAGIDHAAVRWWRTTSAAVLAFVAVCAVVMLFPAGRAMLFANLGAVRQARAELSLYDQARFDTLTLDDVRRHTDLDEAIADLRRTLEIEPGQPTASRRLTMIHLARGNYEESLQVMETAWALGHRDHTSRWLLTDALVANGQIDRAVTLLSHLPGAAERLKSQAWYRYWTHDDFSRAHDAWTAAARLDPSDAEARRMAETAGRRASTFPP